MATRLTFSNYETPRLHAFHEAVMNEAANPPWGAMLYTPASIRVVFGHLSLWYTADFRLLLIEFIARVARAALASLVFPGAGAWWRAEG